MVKRVFYKAATLVLHPWYRLSRGMTLGTRTVVLDGLGQVLLVRHGYAPGWLLPGGGVERGETIFASARRELREEASIEALEEPQLFGFYLNDAKFRGDHVALMAVRAYRQHVFKPGLEIAEARFFPLEALPEGTTSGTRRRIAEVTGNLPAAATW